MNFCKAVTRRLWLILVIIDALLLSSTRPSSAAAGFGEDGGIARIVSMRGPVTLNRGGLGEIPLNLAGMTTNCDIVLQRGDLLLTGDAGDALVRMGDGLVRLYENDSLNFPQSGLLEMLRGAFYFFTGKRPAGFRWRTPTLVGGSENTEYELRVTADQTVVTVYQGEVGVTNRAQPDLHEILNSTNRLLPVELLARGSEPFRIRTVTPGIQWWLHYPGVLFASELPLDPVSRSRLEPSLNAYASGNLLQALSLAPTNDLAIASDGERVYWSALQLVMGRTDLAQEALQDVSSAPSLTNAIHLVIESVTGTSAPVVLQPRTASEWLGYSYLLQARHDLAGALRAATNAQVPGFGFAASRVAELLFSFGRRVQASELLAQSMTSNAYDLTLEGYLAAAADQSRPAKNAFQTAIQRDPTLDDAWLGRGLMRIREGTRDGLKSGLVDLHTAAGLAPDRAFLRSYLGKGFQAANDFTNATRELEYARVLDPNDPTPWLYLALLRQEENRINDGIRELVGSVERNDNRWIYRSQYLLDQDRAVRGANLASLYRDAGMPLFSVREASRAVEADYANPSAHLFLADSYDTLRDPAQADLRFETPWLSEFLIGNLLAPVGVGPLSQTVSHNEYSRLFEQRRPLGVSSTTEYLSRGDWRESAAAYGIEDHISYSAEVEYLHEAGERPNADVESTAVGPRVKLQVSPEDSIYLQATVSEYTAGDPNRYLYDSWANPLQRVHEHLEPLVFAGYHHEWSPEQHTLFLFGGFRDTLELSDPLYQVPIFRTDTSGSIDRPPVPLAPPSQRGMNAQSLTYDSHFDGLSFDLQQIAVVPELGRWIPGTHTFVGGAQWQGGHIETQSQIGEGASAYYRITGSPPRLGDPILVQTEAINQTVTADFQRTSVHGYDFWEWQPGCVLSLGISYDRLRYPQNFRSPPLSDAEATKDQISPKVGISVRTWTNGVWRAAYSRSLGGVGFDQSFRIEPTQLAGVNEAFRSLIPESVAGPIAAPEFEVAGIGFDQRLGTDTFISLSGAWRRSTATQTVGAFHGVAITPDGSLEIEPSGIREALGYTEWELNLAVQRLLDRNWSAGFTYHFTDATLKSDVEMATDLAQSVLDAREHASLHEIGPNLTFNSADGWFVSAQSLFIAQSGQDPAVGRFDDSFWQVNLFAGYRFFHRQAEARIGFLNLTDEDYHLHPVTLYSRYPRSRTLSLRLSFSF